MLLREILLKLPKRLDRGLNPRIERLPGTDRLPRYRVLRPPNARDSLVGITVADRYYVLSILGMGGISVVYKARRSIGLSPKSSP